MKQPSYFNLWHLSVTILFVLAGVWVTGCRQNSLPVIGSIDAAKTQVSPAEDVDIRCVASDPDSDVLTYSWTPSAGSISGQGPAIEWRAPDTPGTYNIRVSVADGKGGEVIEEVKVNVANHAPLIQSLKASPATVDQEKSSALECQAADPDGDPISFIWSASGGGISGSGAAITWKAPPAAGTYNIMVRVKDDKGGETTDQTQIKVVVNRPPAIEHLFAEPVVVPASGQATITCEASDPDSDSLTYAWSADDGRFEGQGAQVTWLATENCSFHTITVTVNDGRGGQAKKDLSIQVKKPGG